MKNDKNEKKGSSIASPKTIYTLKEAVLDAVGTLKTSGSFTAHDVTKTVRQSVNDGEYILPGLEAAAGSGFAYNVNHESIKEVIDSLLNDGTLANLGLSGVDYSGQFRTFKFSSNSTDADEDVETVDTDTDADEAASPVVQRIDAYLDRNGSSTIRKIHSALKIKGLTSKDLYELLTKADYVINEGAEGAYSTYTVQA